LDLRAQPVQERLEVRAGVIVELGRNRVAIAIGVAHRQGATKPEDLPDPVGRVFGN
jgi:hypothetical protein